MKKFAVSIISVLLLSVSASGIEKQQKEVKPTAENPIVLKSKKRKVKISTKESKNIRPEDIHGISVKNDTIFIQVSDSIISKYKTSKPV